MRRLALTCFLVLAYGTSVATGDEGPVPFTYRLALRRINTDLAKLGLAQEVAWLRSILYRLGDSEEDLAKLDARWDKELERGVDNDLKRRRAADRVRAETARLARLIDREDEAGSRALAVLLLELDSTEATANRALGRILVRGSWVTEESVAREKTKGRISDLVQRTRYLDFKAVHLQSQLPVTDLFDGEPVTEVRVRGISVHGRFEAAKLERIVVSALQGAALSNALIGNQLAVPKRLLGRHFLLLESDERYEVALMESHRNQGISVEVLESQSSFDYGTFKDHRGWVTSRWRTEADFKALLLASLVDDVLDTGAQPCLVAGHVNWLSLALFGASMPPHESMELVEKRTISDADRRRIQEVFFRSAARSLYGCRSWMLQLAVRNGDPPWSRVMTRHIGQIGGDVLYKATLVNEYLQESGLLGSLLETTRGADDRTDAFERALGQTLPELEDEWTEWLVHGETGTPPGLAQRLDGRVAVTSSSLETRMAAALDRVRTRAFEGQEREIERIASYPDLSSGARDHARYLARHADQQERWPDAHEEYSDREGFSPAGSWSGLHSVIHYIADPAEAIDGWMATFYHRLPLLNPGLFGIGVGFENGVMVLDVGSLVLDPWREHWVQWPVDGAKDVPLAFQAEVPNPIPGEDQERWGYPITLQAFLPRQDLEVSVALRLFRGEPNAGDEVASHTITPETPRFEKLVPANAWCLIPKAHLDAGTDYTVVARIPQGEPENGVEDQVWRFRTVE